MIDRYFVFSFPHLTNLHSPSCVRRRKDKKLFKTSQSFRPQTNPCEHEEEPGRGRKAGVHGPLRINLWTPDPRLGPTCRRLSSWLLLPPKRSIKGSHPSLSLCCASWHWIQHKKGFSRIDSGSHRYRGVRLTVMFNPSRAFVSTVKCPCSCCALTYWPASFFFLFSIDPLWTALWSSMGK